LKSTSEKREPPAPAGPRIAGWRSVAWGGVQFAVPREWEPGRIGGRHLLFESETGPAMEIKWGPSGRRFSGRRYLKRLARQVGRAGGIFRERALPVAEGRFQWPFESLGFEWAGRDGGALGALLFCPVCRTVTLVQFFRRGPGAEGDRQAARVIGSLQDHRSDGRCAWALYDIRAVVPVHYRLVGHRFEVGRFVLKFRGQRRELTLYRWAPTGVLLKNQDLSAFAAGSAGGAGMDFRFRAGADRSEVEGVDPRPVGLMNRLKAVLKRPRFRGVRVWCVEGRNRILGIRLEAPQPVTAAELSELCRAYGMDEETKNQTGVDPI
jgi:hypothetical protein